MVVLHILADGNTGGTEILCSNYLSKSQNTNIVACLWGLGSIADEMIKKGYNVIDLHCKHFDILGITKKIIGICDKYGVQAIIAHHSIAASHMSLLLIKRLRPDIGLFFYAQTNAERICRANHKVLEKIQYKIIRKFYLKADCVIAISHNVKDSLIKYFGQRKDVPVVIYNGVPLENIGKRDSNRIKEKLTFIYVGRLIDEKGVQITLKALANLKEDYQFIIVGDGPYRTELEKLAKELEISNKVTFTGFRRDIPDLLKNADFFIHVPLCQEGFGLTVVEAMSVGLVCIGSNNGALPEIIENGKNGYIVGADSKELSECIKECLKKYGTQADDNMRKAAIARSEDFSLAEYAKKMDSLINTTVNKAN